MPEEPQPQLIHWLHKEIANLRGRLKSNSLPRNSGYNRKMRISRLSILARCNSLLLTLCLMAAPLCATRCALASCFQTNSPQQSSTGCHHQFAESQGNFVFAAIPAASCLPTDSLFTTLSAPQSRLLLTISNHDAPQLSASISTPAGTKPFDSSRFRNLSLDSSPGDFVEIPSITPLRL